LKNKAHSANISHPRRGCFRRHLWSPVVTKGACGHIRYNTQMLPRRNFLTASRPGHQALRRAQGFQDAESRTRKTRCRGARGSQQFKATYADVRIVRISDQRIGLRLSPERGTGKTLAVPNVTEDSNFGFGVRVIVNGAWGFASSPIVPRRRSRASPAKPSSSPRPWPVRYTA
jgi:hypothetical protein